MKQQEFENSFKQKIKVLIPLTIGCVWEDTWNNFSSSHVTELLKYQVSENTFFGTRYAVKVTEAADLDLAFNFIFSLLYFVWMKIEAMPFYILSVTYSTAFFYSLAKAVVI